MPWLTAVLLLVAFAVVFRAFTRTRPKAAADTPYVPTKAEVRDKQREWYDAVQRGPLPQLSNEKAPWNWRWRNSIAICTSVRQENTTDLREWLLYYQCALPTGDLVRRPDSGHVLQPSQIFETWSGPLLRLQS